MIPGGPKVRARFQKPRHNPTEQFLDCMAQRSAIWSQKMVTYWLGHNFGGCCWKSQVKKFLAKITTQKARDMKSTLFFGCLYMLSRWLWIMCTYHKNSIASGRSCYNVLAHEASCSIISFWKITKNFKVKTQRKCAWLKLCRHEELVHVYWHVEHHVKTKVRHIWLAICLHLNSLAI